MRIEHVAMYVDDLEGARDFFTGYLGGISNEGYHNPRTGFSSYFICFEDGARLELMNKPKMTDAQKPLDRTGYAHIAFSLGSREQVHLLPAAEGEGGPAHRPAAAERLRGRQRPENNRRWIL